MLLVLAIVIAVGGYFVFVKESKPIPIPINQQSTARTNKIPKFIPSVPTFTENKASNWKTYQNDKYGFTFSYPDDWKLKEIYDRTKDGVTYPNQEKNIIDSYIDIEKDGYVLRFEINNQNLIGGILFSTKDYNYKYFTLKNGVEVWRTKNPEGSERPGGLFLLGVVTPYTGDLQQDYDSILSSIIMRNDSLSFSVYYLLPQDTSERNYNSTLIEIMDEIVKSLTITEISKL